MSVEVNLEKLCDGARWPRWKKQMQLFLCAKGVWDAVEIKASNASVDDASGSDKENAGETKSFSISPANKALAQLIILSHLDDRHIDIVATCPDASSIWKKLCSIYEQSNAQRLDRLFEKFFKYECLSSDTITDIVGGLQNLFVEINQDLRAVCNGSELPEILLISRIISCLPDRFASFRDAWDAVPFSDRTLNNLIERLRLMEMRQLDSLSTLSATVCETCRCNGGQRIGADNGGRHRGGDSGGQRRGGSSGGQRRGGDQGGQRRGGDNGSQRRGGDYGGDRRGADDSGVIRTSYAAALLGDDEAAKAFSVSQRRRREGDTWIVDSGAGRHLTGNKNLLHNFVECSGPKVESANGALLNSKGKGDVKLKKYKPNMAGADILILKDVLYVPGIVHNLFSVPTSSDRGNMTIFHKKVCYVHEKKQSGKPGEVIATGRRLDGIFVLNAAADESGKNIVSMKNVANNSASINSSEKANKKVKSPESSQKVDEKTWHRRLCHLGLKGMRKLKGMVRGLNFDSQDFEQCVHCIKGKMTRLPAPKEGTRATEKLQIVSSDICGPFSPSVSKAKYMLLFIDDFTRQTFVYFLNYKSETFEKFQEFKVMAENQSGCKIRTFRSDGGGEYTSRKFEDFLKSHGIRHEMTAPACSFQNGTCERANRTIVDKVRTMLSESGLPHMFWAEAARTVVYLKNRCPTVAVKGKTPQEAWTGKNVSLSHLRTFGCAAYSHVKHPKSKLDPRGQEFILMGYSDTRKAYRLLDLNDPSNIWFSRDVVFIENVFPGRDFDFREGSSNVPLVQLKPIPESEFSCDEIDGRQTDSRISSPQLPSSRQLPSTQVESDPATSEGGGEVPATPTADPDYSPGHSDSNGSEDESPAVTTEAVRRSPYPQRQRRVCTRYNSDQYILSDRTLNSDDEIDLIAFSANVVPNGDNINFNEALNNPNWREAMDVEMGAMKENNVWTLVDLPPGKKVIRSRWVFKLKRDTDGNVERHKARLVARGYTQKPGIDYGETYSPVVKFSTVRTLLALAASENLLVDHMDVTSAFLYGDIDRDIYMEQPAGFVSKEYPKKVCKLKKCIYGLHQSARQWHNRLKEVLNTLEYKSCAGEPCVFYNIRNGELSIIMVFVDDLILIGRNKNIMARIKSLLMSQFKMRDLGPVKDLLGMRVRRDDSGIKIDQSTYINNIISQFQMTDCNAVCTPMEPGLKLEKPAEGEEVNDVPYRQLIGCLTYLSVTTRPDIANSVNRLAQFNEHHSNAHWQAAKRILRYLKGSIDYCLFYKNDKLSGSLISACVDADWGENLVDRKSFSGFVVKFGEGTVSWESRKQSIVAQSSCEAEYISMADLSREILFLRAILEELLGTIGKVPISSDSQSAISLTVNEMVNRRTKHIDMRHHLCRDLVQKGIIEFRFCPGTDNIADVMTKPLPRQKHEFCVKGILNF